MYFSLCECECESILNVLLFSQRFVLNTWNDLSFNVKNIFYGKTLPLNGNLIINIIILYAKQYIFYKKCFSI